MSDGCGVDAGDVAEKSAPYIRRLFDVQLGERLVTVSSGSAARTNRKGIASSHRLNRGFDGFSIKDQNHAVVRLQSSSLMFFTWTPVAGLPSAPPATPPATPAAAILSRVCRPVATMVPNTV